jgi:hypothetical protein
VTRLRRLLIVFVLTAAFMAAVIVFVFTPSRPLRTTAAPDAFGHMLRGAFHIHTIQSDGALDREEIALAASRAGLHFAIFTDHGDGTRPPKPPEYLHGVLCIEGVEVSTNQGHYVALGLTTAAPYPLGGDADAVAEDVTRLGGFGIAAHPSSPRAELAWSDWNVPIDGIEWLNADTQWRDESKAALTRALLGYLTRPGGALASLLDRPEAALSKLDELAARRHVVAVAGHDAHGGFGEENGARGRRLHLPSYEAAFRTFSVNVQVDEALKGTALDDAGAVLDAIRRGRVFTAIDAIASPATLDFRAIDGNATAVVGDVLSDDGHDVTLLARAAMPAGASLVLLHNGSVVRENSSSSVQYSTRSPGSYRVEVRVPGAPGTPPIPWIVSSPIFRFAVSRADASPAPLPETLVRAIAAEEWHLEKGGGTTAAFSLSSAGVTLTYRLGTNPSPYAALAADLPSETGGGFTHVGFKGRASKPMRISTQLRFSADGAIRWRRPVYLATGQSSFTFDASTFRAADRPGNMPDTSRASSVLFVIDTTNAMPGDEGSFTIQGVELRR